MNILLTGASGTVGREVLEMLSELPDLKVRAFDIDTKKTRKNLRSFESSVEVVYGDICNRDDVAEVSKDIDVAIQLAAIIPPLADEKPKLAYTVNTIGTKHLIDSLEQHSPEAFFLFSSSVSVYGDRLHNYEITVGDPLVASIGDEYAKTKIEAEKIIQSSKLSWSIFRLSAIQGIGNHQMSGLMFHMPLETKIEMTSPKDTARAFVNAIENAEILNRRIFKLGGGENFRITYEDFIRKNFKISGLGKLNFPDKAFAEKNFHCGYYADGDQLNEVLNFRSDTVDDYFTALEKSISVSTKLFTRLLNPLIKRYLLTLSEPLHAFKKKDAQLMDRFFHQV